MFTRPCPKSDKSGTGTGPSKNGGTSGQRTAEGFHRQEKARVLAEVPVSHGETNLSKNPPSLGDAEDFGYAQKRQTGERYVCVCLPSYCKRTM